LGQGNEPRPIRPILTERSSSGVFLARHGQTAYNHEGRFQGQQQIPLDETGREQARELAERAVPYEFAALWCSPLLRARETADAVAARTGIEPIEDARLMETDSGEWTDRFFADVRAEDPARFDAFAAADPGFAFPGGESFAEQEVRVEAALAEIQRGPLPALVVCHGMVIRAAMHRRVRAGGGEFAAFTRVPNAALVPLDPISAEHADLGGGAASTPS
jgi:broad specificity phosphatase PhoE